MKTDRAKRGKIAQRLRVTGLRRKLQFIPTSGKHHDVIAKQVRGKKYKVPCRIYSGILGKRPRNSLPLIRRECPRDNIITIGFYTDSSQPL